MQAHRPTSTTTDDGVTLHWSEYGPDQGTPVVLLHGLAANALQFHDDAVHLASQGVRTLVPDLRGHGRSKVEDAAGTDFSIDRLVRDMMAVLDAAGADRVHWVGNSLGGIVALRLSELEPGRFETLTTFGTCFRISLPDAVEAIFPIIYGFPGAAATSWMTARMTTSNPEGRRIIQSMVADFDPAAGAALSRVLRQYDLRAAAAVFPHPFLVLRGGKDIAVNLALDPNLGLLDSRSSTVLDMKQAGHCANLDDPQAFRDAIGRFWSHARSVSPARPARA